jgi:hypothetical protein
MVWNLALSCGVNGGSPPGCGDFARDALALLAPVPCGTTGVIPVIVGSGPA